MTFYFELYAFLCFGVFAIACYRQVLAEITDKAENDNIMKLKKENSDQFGK